MNDSINLIDKFNLIESIASREFVKLELGCGPRKLDKLSIGIDALDYPCVDIIGDIFQVLARLPDAVVDEVYSSHFIEHIPDTAKLLNELARVMKADGELIIIAPHFSNPYYYSDFTHKTFFGLYSMSYLAQDEILWRKVPTYQQELNFDVIDIHLGFKSSPPFYLRHGFKKCIEFLVNLNSYTKELYEEMFCYLFPCYEVRYKMRRFGR